MADVIERIRQKLAYLREYEDFDVTDADSARRSQIYSQRDYRYQLHAPASEAQVAVYEAQHEIRFPDDYRRFLLEVGTGGAGLGYDLYSPFDETMTLANGDSCSIVAPHQGQLHRPFPFIEYTSADTVSSVMATVNALYGRQGIEDFFCAGHLMIAYSGCQCWHLLILTGDARGQIWYTDGFYAPVMLSGGKFYDDAASVPPDAERVTFTRWYEAWLDVEIATSRQHWTGRGRDVPPLIFTENEEPDG